MTTLPWLPAPPRPLRGVRPAPGRGAFVRRALADQASVGAIAPTSVTLADRIARLVPRTPGARVLELGAGTGAITRRIAARLGPDAVQVAVERDPHLAEHLAETAPAALTVCGDAAHLAECLEDLGIDRVEVVVSSLPWSNFPAATQTQILAQVRSVLTDTGTFATIAYRPTRLNPSSRRFRRLLDTSFEQVLATATTWRNLPPARLLVAHRPRTGTDHE